ncbi:glycosyltransferase%2C putative [Streptococcus pneumoniae]|nr:glycosyltransferase%2C putative [Streptococcus pneumoniae]CKI68104.1 glycosyltransferase%2C putative [Streptococcus pneumoniae]
MNYLVIPAYQPDFNLLTLIEKIHKKGDFSIIVIDDGSSPECKEIFAQAENYGTVLRHQVNQGKGQALKTAFAYIQSLKMPGTIVTADADGQHKIWDILRTSNEANENPSTLVLGVRAFTGKVPLRSRFGNSLTRILFKIQTGVAVSDTQTGLRAFTTDLIPFMMELVFKNKASNLKTGAGYLTLSVVLFFLDTLLISLFNTGFGINLFMAKIFVGMLLFMVSWTVQTRYIFKERTCYPV